MGSRVVRLSPGSNTTSFWLHSWNSSEPAGRQALPLVTDNCNSSEPAGRQALPLVTDNCNSSEPAGRQALPLVTDNCNSSEPAGRQALPLVTDNCNSSEPAVIEPGELVSCSLGFLYCCYIDIYNALTIHGLAVSEQLPRSVLDVSKFWQSTSYNIGGLVFSLDDIEHGVLRGQPLTAAYKDLNCSV